MHREQNVACFFARPKKRKKTKAEHKCQLRSLLAILLSSKTSPLQTISSAYSCWVGIVQVLSKPVGEQPRSCGSMTSCLSCHNPVIECERLSRNSNQQPIGPRGY